MSIQNEVLGNSRGGRFLGGVHLGSVAVPYPHLSYHSHWQILLHIKSNLSYCCIEFQTISYEMHLYLDQCRFCRIGLRTNPNLAPW